MSFCCFYLVKLFIYLFSMNKFLSITCVELFNIHLRSTLNTLVRHNSTVNCKLGSNYNLTNSYNTFMTLFLVIFYLLVFELNINLIVASLQDSKFFLGIYLLIFSSKKNVTIILKCFVEFK